MIIYVALSNFFSAPVFKPVRDRCRAVLLSYADVVRGARRAQVVLDEMRAGRKRVFIDSGAYSAKHSGVPVTLDGYVGYLKDNPDLTVYANLDVIGDAKATLANQRLMEKAGLRPIPVFHFGEPWRVFEDYLKNYDYVGFGGVAKRHHTTLGRRWLREGWARVAKHWPKKIHGFGLKSPKLLLAYPFYSVDASSVTHNAGMGIAWEYDKRGQTLHKPVSWTGPKNKAWVKVMHMRGRGSPAVVVRALHNLICMHEMEDHVNAVWKSKGVTWK